MALHNSPMHRPAKATLTAQREQARQESERLLAAVKRARLFAGDNLPTVEGGVS